ncbi:hypothetical protein RsoM2USA_427 [Ralstonia phage RsoM2USA]|nr:hypothetical protein RsoM2USA_427 [Ralstonia phage RsoM2USA]
MPRNQQKNYTYVPNFRLNSTQQMPSFESFRSRLEIGGTFFRSKAIGTEANKISVTCTVSGTTFTLLVQSTISVKNVTYTGTATKYGVNVVAPDTSVPQDVTLSFSSATSFSMTGSVSGTTGPFQVGSAARIAGCIVTVIPGSSPFSSGDKIKFSVVKPRETYSADQSGAIDPITGAFVGTSAIPAIRAAVNAQSSLIEMPERGYDYVDLVGTDSGSGRTVGRSGPLLTPEGALSVFPQTLLYGASGPPSNPSGIQTGPERTLIHLNRTENDQGALVSIGKVLEFVGSSVYNGFFQEY